MDSDSPHNKSVTAESTGTPRSRRRPPSLSEQRNRTQRIAPWARDWKALKAAGRWQ